MRYTRLIALRHEHPALYSRDIRMLDLAAGENVLAYPRSAGTASETILVLLNYWVLPAQVTIPSDVAEKMHGRGLRDLLTGEAMTIADGKIAVTGEALRILKLQ